MEEEKIQKIELKFSQARMSLDEPLELGGSYVVVGRVECRTKNEYTNDDGSKDVVYSIRFRPEGFKIEKE